VSVGLKETRVIGTTTPYKRNQVHHGAWLLYPEDPPTSLIRLSELQVTTALQNMQQFNLEE
jgi:hypothetical protein